jgi:hypothetical protein
MATGLIEIAGSDVFCSIAGRGREACFPLTEATPKLQGWARRYDKASQRDDEVELASIGREMYDWLAEQGWASSWAEAVGGDRVLEVRVGGKGGANETALLDLPWELLAPADGPLALDPLQLFIVARRVGASGQAHVALGPCDREGLGGVNDSPPAVMAIALVEDPI